MVRGALATRLLEKGLLDRRPGKGRALVHRLIDERRLMFERGGVIAADARAAAFAALSEVERRQLWAPLQ